MRGCFGNFKIHFSMDTKRLTDILAERLGKGSEETGALVNALSLTIADALKDGNSVAIPSVGSFETKMRAERLTVHPSSGKRLLIPPKLTVVFKPAAALKQRIK